MPDQDVSSEHSLIGSLVINGSDYLVEQRGRLQKHRFRILPIYNIDLFEHGFRTDSYFIDNS